MRVPSGASLLCAVAVLAAAGLCEGVLPTLTLGRAACVLWALATAAISAVNLPLPGGGVLVNPGGTLLPACFCLFVLSRRRRSGRALARFAVAAVAVGIILCTVPAWAAEAGVGWQAGVLAAVCAAVSARGPVRGAGEALAAASAGLAVAAALRYAAGAYNLLPWPGALGGGGTFDAGVLALIGGQVLQRLPSLWRSIVRGPLSTQGRRAQDAAR